MTFSTDVSCRAAGRELSLVIGTSHREGTNLPWVKGLAPGKMQTLRLTCSSDPCRRARASVLLFAYCWSLGIQWVHASSSGLHLAGWLLSMQLQMQTLELQRAACAAGPGTCIQISPGARATALGGLTPASPGKHRAETPAVAAAAGTLAQGPN